MNTLAGKFLSHHFTILNISFANTVTPEAIKDRRTGRLFVPQQYTTATFSLGESILILRDQFMLTYRGTWLVVVPNP
jgi:hypothetical protein